MNGEILRDENSDAELEMEQEDPENIFNHEELDHAKKIIEEDRKRHLHDIN